MTRAYRVAVFGGGPGGSEGLRARMARGRPNWWVILAVSLGLIAVLVATSTGAPSTAPHGGGGAEAAARTAHRGIATGAPDPRRATVAPTTTTTLAAAPTTTTVAPVAATHTSSSGSSGVAAGPAPAAGVTTTTVAPTTTTTSPAASVPAQSADRTVAQGYLDPPNPSSDRYDFTGTGAMQVSVVWAGSTYLTMQVSCGGGTQNVGGAGAMAASLPDASGSCLATVTEPSDETTSLTFTITIGPAGG